MLVTNPAARAPLSEVLSHPWMVRGFKGPPDSHLVHREPLRADELDKQVIKGMKGFEFGTEEEIERRLVEVLESDAYYRSVQHWERKRMSAGLNGRNGHGSGWGGSMSNSSITLTFDGIPGAKSDLSATPSKKAKRFSGFGFYGRKLFSPSSSPPHSLSNSPPTSQSHLSHTSLTDAQREPPDPTYGFHPLISIYFLAREKLERERVYGPGQFASSQLSLETSSRVEPAVEAAPPVSSAKQLSQPAIRKPDAVVSAKQDYSMPLPRLPAPETSHYSGMSYDPAAAAPSPTSPNFPQPRARDPALSVGGTIPKSPTPLGAGGVTTMPQAPQATQHRRSHSLSTRPVVPNVARGWTTMFGPSTGHPTVDEHGVVEKPEIAEPPRTAGPELTSFAERMEDHYGPDELRPPMSAGATLVRKFGSLLGGTRDGSMRNGTVKRGSILSNFSPRPSAEVEKTASTPAAAVDEKDVQGDKENEKLDATAPPSAISQSQSQPIGANHRRAATILDPQGRTTRHERRSSTGASLFSAGTIGRHRRPSTGYGGAPTRPLGDRLFGRTDEEDEAADPDENDPPTPAANGDDHLHGGEAGGDDFKPVFLKGLFR